MHRELGGAVDLEAGVRALDEPDEADVLHDRGVDAAVDALAEVEQRLTQLVRLHEDVEREVDAGAAPMRDEATLFEFVEGELGAVVACVEPRRPEVHRVGPVRDRGPHGFERAGRRQ
jgi:hypothetical protein